MGIRAQAPIYASNGKMVAFWASPCRADKYLQRLRRVDISAAIGIGIAALLALLNGWRYGGVSARAMPPSPPSPLHANGWIVRIN